MYLNSNMGSGVVVKKPDNGDSNSESLREKILAEAHKVLNDVDYGRDHVNGVAVLEEQGRGYLAILNPGENGNDTYLKKMGIKGTDIKNINPEDRETLAMTANKLLMIAYEKGGRVDPSLINDGNYAMAENTLYQ